jgi:CRISPR-associated protein (TIGR02584 family)
MENKRNILLCVAGMSPQIITETLYYLTQVEKPAVRIDEIRVITTLDGKYKVMSTLLDKNKGEFFNFCRDYGIQPDSIKFDETCISLLQTKDKKVLKDIRTPEENELAGNQICEIIRELCKDENTRIFASAAGGRKTMSIYLTLAMSLFARAEDTLSHVLVSENFEGTDFFYPPRELKTIQIFNSQNGETKEISTADAKIYLAPIPFIRFRGIGSENQKFTEARSYGEIVEEAQKVLDIREKEYDLRINIKKQSVFVRGETVKLPKREFFFYLMFARRAEKGCNPVSLRNLKREDFHQILKEIMLKTKNEDVDWEEIYAFPKYKFAEIMYSQLFEAKKEKKEIDFQEFRNAFSTVVTRIRKNFEKVGICDDRYYLVSTNDKTASYRFGIKPERIIFE